MIFNRIIGFTSLLILFSSSIVFSQTSLSGDTEIEGIWKSTKPGKEITIEIRNGNAVIVDVEGTLFPKETLGGKTYENIKRSGDVWTATRNKWIYPGENGENVSEGKWEKGEELVLKLSEDKTQLIAVGHWTYNRVETKTQNSVMDLTDSDDNSTELKESYGEVEASYLFVKSEKLIVAKFKNLSQTKRAVLLIKTADGKLYIETIDPGYMLTLKFKGLALDVQVNLEDANSEKSDTRYMDFIKGEIRKIVVDENKENPKPQSTTVGGSRG